MGEIWKKNYPTIFDDQGNPRLTQKQTGITNPPSSPMDGQDVYDQEALARIEREAAKSKYASKDYMGDNAGPSAWEQVKYGFDLQKSDVQSAGQIMEAKMPLGRLFAKNPKTGKTEFYVSPEDLYGEDFIKADYENRIKILEQKRVEAVQAAHPEAAASGDTGWSIAGRVGGALTTPTTAVPIGAGFNLAKGAAIGGTIAAADMALHDEATYGKVDPRGVMGAFMVGAVGVPAFQMLGKKLHYGTKVKVAKRLVDDVERDIVHAIAKGDTKPQVAAARVLKTYGIKGMKDMKKATDLAGREIGIPSVRAAKAIVAREAEEAASRQGKLGGWGDYLRSTRSRIQELSPTFGGRLTKAEQSILAGVHEHSDAVRGFVEGYRKMPKALRTKISLALHNRDMKELDRLLAGRKARVGDTADSVFKKKDIDMLEEFKNVRKVLDDIYDMGRSRGMRIQKLDNYYPRLVKDGKYITADPQLAARTGLNKELARIKKAMGREMTERELESAAKYFFQGLKFKKMLGGHVSYQKARKIPKITEKQLPGYADPVEAIHNYISKMHEEVAMRDLLNVRAPQEWNVGETITKVMGELGDLSPENQRKFAELVSARVQAGRVHSPAYIQHAKNLMYAGTLGNPVAAMSQLQDIGFSAYMNGFGNALKATVGKRYVKAVDLGLTNAAQEMVNLQSTARLANKVLKFGGFQRMDRLGKDIVLNSRMRQMMNLATKDKGKLLRETEHLFINSKEQQQFIKDVLKVKKGGDASPLVKLALFDRIFDMQPVTLSDMPLKYLTSPEGRIFYTLKSFTLRQLSTIYKEGIQGFSKHPVQNAKNLAGITAMLGGAGVGAETIKDLMTGQFDEKSVSDRAVNSFFKMWGGSSFLADKAAKGRFYDTAINLAAPAPMQFGLGILEDVYDSETKVKDKRVWQYLPVGGKFYWYFLGGGQKDYHYKHQNTARGQRPKKYEYRR